MLSPRLSALLGLVSLLTASEPAVGQGQPPRSSGPPARLGMPRLPPDFPAHILPDGEQPVTDFRKWLLGLNKKPLPKDIDPNLLRQLMERLPKDHKADAKQIQELLQENPNFKDPAFLNQLEKMVQDEQNFPNNLKGKLPKDGPPVAPIQDRDVLKENLEQVIEKGKSPTLPEGMPKGDPTAGPKVDPSQIDPSRIDPKTLNPASENEWARWIQKHFGDSPAGQAALKDLMSALEKQDMKGMFDQVPEFKNGGWKDLDRWGKSNAPDLWKMKPPDLSGSKVTPPKIAGTSGGPSFGGGGSGGGSGFGGGGVDLGSGSALAVIVGIAGAILLAILLFRKWKLNQAERQAAAAALAKAGIDFDSIRTREELVRAFDHVSLDQIGEEARSWNHRVIADQIADARPAQAEPAGELAGLYERARYAPLDEDLSAGEFADARRDLRVIAGVPA